MIHSGAHDESLVALSVLIATAASYTALDLASRMRASSGWPHWAWLGGAALAMGGGIWSMHFVAMLAFSVPGLEASYDLGLTLLSLALPIAVTAFGFVVASRKEGGAIPTVASGIVMGVGIAGMHYSGMAAMRMPADLRHDHLWVAISILIAIGAAVAALWVASQRTGHRQRIAAAIVMGLAVSGMHYAAMRGAVFTAHAPVDQARGMASVGQMNLALWVTGTTFLILTLSLVAAMFDRHFAFRSEQEAVRLRESEERFRLLLQAVTDYAIYMLDPEGRVANWNSGAQRIKGYNAAEVIGTSFHRFYTEEDRSSGLPDQALQTAAREGRFEAEGWRVRKDGSRFWASVVLDVIRDEAGQLVGFAKITRDITDKREAQEELERAREALAQSQKMEAIGQLTGGVAHDFNNLLMAITGSLELLKKRVPDDPRINRLVDNAVQAAARGAALTQRMLAFARRQDLRPDAVDLPNLVGGMADLLQRSIGPAVKIETNFPADLPRALVDANQLELALLNLVVNARDAMPNGGTISIAGRFEPGSPDATGSQTPRVVLAVSDTGQGMDSETLARAQEPFFTTKGVGKGTGLGLSMVHGLAEQSNGRLAISSREGVGTTAEIWLPLAPEASSEKPLQRPALARVQRLPKLTVLVVDDDPLVLENAAAMVEDLGHTVLQAHSGEEALQLAGTTPSLDLVITDQAMPGMTGLELAAALAERRAGLPIILASGFADIPADAALRLRRLSKPFDQETLGRMIQAAMHEPSVSNGVAARITRWPNPDVDESRSIA
jgi:PAS domain S-box-containing protein